MLFAMLKYKLTLRAAFMIHRGEFFPISTFKLKVIQATRIPKEAQFSKSAMKVKDSPMFMLWCNLMTLIILDLQISTRKCYRSLNKHRYSNPKSYDADCKIFFCTNYMMNRICTPKNCKINVLFFDIVLRCTRNSDKNTKN